MDADDIISAPDIEAALAAGDLNRVLRALTLGVAPWCRGSRSHCNCCGGGEQCEHCAAGPEERWVRDNSTVEQRLLSQLAQLVPAGQLQLARGTEGAMQLLALLRESLRWLHHAAAEAFASFAATGGAPQLLLSWWRTLLLGALPCVVEPQLPALHCATRPLPEQGSPAPCALLQHTTGADECAAAKNAPLLPSGCPGACKLPCATTS